MRDRLRSAGFRCGKPVAGKTYFDIAVPLTFPCCYDVAGKNYAANQDVLRSKPQLVKYLEGCLALAREEASYRTEAEREGAVAVSAGVGLSATCMHSARSCRSCSAHRK